MPEEVFETPQPTESKPTNWPKIILAVVLGLALLTGAAYAGYWYGMQQAQQPEIPIPLPEPRINKSEEIPLDIPEELKCEEDNDCGVDFCGCKALNKNYIEPTDKICMMVCDKTPICYRNRCIFKGEENKYEIEKE